MTRSIVTALAAGFGIAVCVGTGCNTTGVGDPCTPEKEFDPTFIGFDFHEVSVESKSFQCLTRLCLVNHFQGRVSCPYGQAANGTPDPGAGPMDCTTASGQGAGCCTPGIPQAVTGVLDSNGDPVDPTNLETVPGQCQERTADKAVYCSCRCENINGQTNDGANYCSCPDGYTCTQLVSAIMAGQTVGLTGGYCVKNGTVYDGTQTCTDCDPNSGGCGPVPAPQ